MPSGRPRAIPRMAQAADLHLPPAGAFDHFDLDFLHRRAPLILTPAGSAPRARLSPASPRLPPPGYVAPLHYDVSMTHASTLRRAEQPPAVTRCVERRLTRPQTPRCRFVVRREQLHRGDEVWMPASVLLSSRCLLILLVELRKLLGHTKQPLQEQPLITPPRGIRSRRQRPRAGTRCGRTFPGSHDPSLRSCSRM
jgi:hypothetical protein